MQHLLGAFPYVDQYVPLRWQVMAPTENPRSARDGADTPDQSLLHHCHRCGPERKHSASSQALSTIGGLSGFTRLILRLRG